MRALTLLVASLLALPAASRAVSPGPNGRIVFVQWRDAVDRFDTPNAYLCSAEPDGGSQSRLTVGSERDGLPRLSPDGSRLAFIRGASTDAGQLWTAEASGANPERVEGVPPIVFSVAWTADGKSILYTASSGSATDVFAVTWPGRVVRRVTSSPEAEGNPVASPDGKRLAWVAVAARSATQLPRELVVAGLAGEDPKVITTNLQVREPKWSPDSRRLIFTAERTGIHSIAADGSDLRRLSVRSDDHAPDYSPDGSRIVFVREGDVWTMDVEGGSLRRLTQTPAREDDPVWQRRDAEAAAAGGAPCAITGTDGNDDLVGTPGDDVFYDLGGDDVVRGLGGKDVVWDGEGADKVEGGPGDDLVILTAGRNTISGGDGNDVLETARYRRVEQGSVIAGDAGDDRITGGDGADRLLGGEGDDVIVGLRGPDTIFAGPGNDQVEANRGDDYVDGGIGDDRLDGGRISGTPARYDGYDVLLGRGGDDRLAGGWQKDRLFGGSGKDRLTGGPHADLLQGEAGRDTLFGQAGDDLLLARDRAPGDELFGGPGFDRATADRRDLRRGIERLLR